MKSYNHCVYFYVIINITITRLLHHNRLNRLLPLNMIHGVTNYSFVYHHY